MNFRNLSFRRVAKRRQRNLLFAGSTALSAFLAIFVPTEAQTTRPPSDSTMMRQVHQALNLAEHGDRQQAMNIAQQLLTRDPKFVPALKLKAMLLEEAGRNTEAAAAYEGALKVAPNDPDLLLKTGVYKLTSGDVEQAIKLLQRCTKVNPTDGDAHYYLAQAYHLNHQDELALTAIRQSLKLDPKNPSVWQKYGALLCSSGDCSQGLRWLLKAHQADATLPRLDYDIAVTDFQLMDLPAAAEYAAMAVQAHPDDLQALRLLATANVKLARWSEGESAFNKILTLKADDVEALLGAGECEVQVTNYPAAVQKLQSALRLDPTRLLAHFYLSRAYAGMGRDDDAQHQAALHQLMMEHATFVRSTANEQRENAISLRAQKMLADHQEDAALNLYQENFKGSSSTLADAYVFVGKLYLFSGKSEDGLRCLHHALKIQPNVRGASTYEGILALKNGDLARAESEFQSELTNDPSYQLAIAEMGEVRYHQERWADAADFLAKSKTTTPELLYMLCDSYFRLGKISDANLNAEAMAAYARNKPAVMQGLLELLKRNGQSDLAKRLGS
jgi:tetratricopeptide (TPR) repeat protein